MTHSTCILKILLLIPISLTKYEYLHHTPVHLFITWRRKQLHLTGFPVFCYMLLKIVVALWQLQQLKFLFEAIYTKMTLKWGFVKYVYAYTNVCVCVGRFVWVYKTMMYVIWTDGCFIILRWLTGTGNRWAQWPSFSSLSSTGKQITELIISEISWMVTVIKVFFNTSCQSCHMTVEGCVAGAVSQFLSNGCNMSPRNQTYCGDAR